jgi:hypothetical protein
MLRGHKYEELEPRNFLPALLFILVSAVIFFKYYV